MNINNHIIASVYTPQYDNNDNDDKPTKPNNTNSNSNSDANSNMNNDDINHLLNYGYDEYTNTLLDKCLYNKIEYNIPLNQRAINCTVKCCIMTILHDIMILNTELQEAMRYIYEK
mgnify:CR=1 FL=1